VSTRVSREPARRPRGGPAPVPCVPPDQEEPVPPLPGMKGTKRPHDYPHRYVGHLGVEPTCGTCWSAAMELTG